MLRVIERRLRFKPFFHGDADARGKDDGWEAMSYENADKPFAAAGWAPVFRHWRKQGYQVRRRVEFEQKQ